MCGSAIRLCETCDADLEACVTSGRQTGLQGLREKDKDIMRKLLITAAAAAGLLMSNVAASAAAPVSGTYTRSQGAYTACVQNNLVNSGATNMVEVDLSGLPRQPSSLTGPAGWGASLFSSTSGWTIKWSTPSFGVGINSQLCGFGFKMHGRPLTAPLNVTIWDMTADGFYCCDLHPSTLVRI